MKSGWLPLLIDSLPFLAFGAIVIISYVRLKKGYRPKKLSLKRMALTLLFWIVVALVLVAIFSPMQGARH